MMKSYRLLILSIILFFVTQFSFAEKPNANISYVVTMEDPATHYYHVSLTYKNIKKETLDFKMCAWTPGYYQIIDFAKAVENFHVADTKGKEIQFEKAAENIWRVHNNKEISIVITYDVKALVPFVGNIYLDDQRGYITPGGLFLYLDEELRNPITIQIKPYSKWPNLVATGLDSLPGKQNTFYAADFDVLYDCPFLMGYLESFPSFTVKGIPHYFIGYNMGEFDRNQFMADLKKIVETGSAIIGDIPYSHYTFLSIGKGGGGIEHLNSSSLSFRGAEDFTKGKKRTYDFIAHEYFHHYNVKRIRPIELGPFDYSKENHTNMLWVSEGFTVYYEYLITRRAGLTTEDDLLKSFQTNLRAYENKPGHLYQSATQASFETWSDGPNGRTNDEVNKTISYYDKGPVLGLMIDFAIRHQTNNKKSLDDVMRLLYKKYYQTKKRGFTEKEFQMECEAMAGISLAEIFEDASTVNAIDYPKYFAYAGLSIDTLIRKLPGAYLGISTRQKDSVVFISEIDWKSPAWNAGLHTKDTILEVDGNKASVESLSNTIKEKKSGDVIRLLVKKGDARDAITILLGTKEEKSFDITRMENPDALQSDIYKSWEKEY